MAIIYPTRIKSSNLGDVLINVLLIRELSKYDIIYLDGYSESFFNLITYNNQHKDNIKYIPGLKFFDGVPVLRWLKLSSALSSVSLVFDPPGHYPEQNALKSFFKSLKYIGRAKILSLMGKKVVRLGITLGPFSDFGWKTQKHVSEAYSVIGIRDKSNFKTLEEKQIRNLVFVDDLSFLYEPSDFVNTGNSYAAKYGEYIVVSFRGNVIGDITDRSYLKPVIEKLMAFLTSEIAEASIKVVFAYQVKEDLEVVREMYLEAKSMNFDSVLIEQQLTLSQIATLYNEANYVVTNRLHVALLALLNSRPAYVVTDIAGHPKLSNVYKDLGLEALLIDSSQMSVMKNLSKSQLDEVMDIFNNRRTEKRDTLKNAINKIANKNARN